MIVDLIFMIIHNLRSFSNCCYPNCCHFVKTSRESRKAALRISHQLSRWQFVLLKYVTITTVTTATVTTVTITYVTISVFEFCHNLICLVLSQFDFLSFVTSWALEFCCNLFFWVLSQFKFFLLLFFPQIFSFSVLSKKK